MTPERWLAIKATLDAALSVAPAERGELISARCDGDSELEREVHELLSFAPPQSDLLDTTTTNGEAAAGFQPALLAGRMVGPYQLVRLLGSGGMGEVYLARDTRLRRDVAIKRLHPRLAATGRYDHQPLREARAVALLSHPNIATVYDVIEQDGQIDVVMEYLRGETLADRLSRAPITEADAFAICLQIASALSHAHERGVLHCDFKPANVFISAANIVKVLDFGLARRAGVFAGGSESHHDSSAQTANGSESDVTDTALRHAGTPAYMSPEQRSAAHLDARSDIYSFGLVMREIIAAAPTTGASSLTARLSPIVDRATNLAPDDRFQSASELLKALDSAAPRRWLGHWSSGTPTTPGIWRFGIIGTLLVCGCAGAVWRGTGPARLKAASTAQGQPSLKLFQLTHNPAGFPVRSVGISPDGRYLSYSDTRGVWLRESNSEPILMPGSEGLTIQRWLDDGSGVVCWSLPRGVRGFVFSKGSPPRDASREEFFGGTSRDGRRSFGDGRQIIDRSGKTPPVAVTMPNKSSVPRWSPEGEFIVFASALADADVLQALDVETGKVAVLARFPHTDNEDWSDLQYVVLTGGRVLYVTPASDAVSLVRVDPNTGTPLGAPQPVISSKDGRPITKLSASADGSRVVFLSPSVQADVYIAVIDDAESHVADVSRLSLNDLDDIPVGWSGNAVYFTSERPGKFVLIRQPLPDGPAVSVEAQGVGAISSDGKYRFYFNDDGPDRHLYVQSLADGDVRKVEAQGIRGWSRFSSVSCGGGAVCVAMTEVDHATAQALRLDGRTKEATELFTAKAACSDMVVSPDGSLLACFAGVVEEFSPDGTRKSHGKILTMDMAGRTVREVPLPPMEAFVVGLAWARNDGLWIVGTSESTGTLVHVDRNGAAHEILKRAGLISAIPSPDGNRLALQVMEGHTNVWEVDLPPE